MTIKELLNHAGVGNIKTAFDRYQHGSHTYYGGGGGGGGHNSYSYQAPSYHGTPHVIKHYSHSDGKGGGNKGNGAALSALTLLSFLFFLNVLQQCLRDQAAATNAQITILTSGREELETMKADKEGKSTSFSSGAQRDGIGRAYAAEEAEKLVKGYTDVSEDEEVPIGLSGPQFVNAMGDGVGEVFNEQK